MKWPAVTLLDSLASAEVFVDGDWVESKDRDPDGDVRLIQLADVGDGEYVDKSDRFLTSAKARELRCTLLRPGDVLVARMPDPLGRACIFPGDPKPSVTVVDVCIIRPDPQKHDPRWLMHCLNAPDCRNQITGYATGTTRSRISRGNLGKVRIPLPPLPEQRRIAEILDKADALRAKRRAALAQLDTLTQSIFLDMFGDPATNPKGWPIRKVEDVAEIVSGATPRTDNESYWDGDVNWVTPKELSGLESMYIGETARRITRQGLESCAASILPPGSVLFSSRAPIGHTAICAAPMATNQGFKSFVPRPGALEPHFLLFLLRLRRSFLEGLGTGATFKEVSKAVVARIELFMPPFDLQSQFAQRVVALERVRSVQREGRGQLDALFTSVQHRAFRGEL